MTHQQIMNKINELEDKITDAKLELAAIDGDDAAAASIALQAANSKIVQAEDEFNLEMSSIEEGAKKVFEEVSTKLDEAQMEDAKKTLEE